MITPAKERMRKSRARRRLGLRPVQVLVTRLEVALDVDRRIEFADRDFARGGNTAFRAYRGMIINDGDGPSGHLWRCCEAAEQAGKPHADATFVGARIVRG
jgi:hypothetical protein